MLKTTDDLPFASPIAHLIGVPLAAMPGRVDLADLSGQRLFNLRGRDAEAALKTAFGGAPGDIGAVLAVEAGRIARLTHDEFVILANENAHVNLADGHLTLTDITHGRGHMLLAGPKAADVLAKVCALDFDASAFPHGRAAQTSLAKVLALIIRWDVAARPAYHLIVDYSLAAYVWEVVFDAMQEFGGAAFSYSA